MKIEDGNICGIRGKYDKIYGLRWIKQAHLQQSWKVFVVLVKKTVANIAFKEHSQMKMKLLVVRRQPPGRLSHRVPDSTWWGHFHIENIDSWDIENVDSWDIENIDSWDIQNIDSWGTKVCI